MLRPMVRGNPSKEEGAKMQKQISTEKNLPAMKFRAGAVSATIWQNKITRKNGEEGSFSTVHLERSYKDKDGNWKNSNSLRASDIPKAMLVLQEAYRNITLNQNSSQQEEEVVY